MKIQKLAIASVVATVFLFLIDWVYYGMLMKDSMDMPTARLDAAGQPAPDMMWLVISYIIFAVAFVTIYSKAAGGGSKVNEGLNFGLWTTLLVSVAMGFMWYALTTMMTLNEALMDMAYSLVKFIILGIIVAYASGIPGSDRGKAQGGGE
ncbi:MAG: hypothetical protein SH808_10375 [Saprospiraceae bacterium]|nr:hypothetical protein [Saprospiraceae bacterium]